MASWDICSDYLRFMVIPNTNYPPSSFFHMPNPDGEGYVRIPRRLANWDQVPEQYRAPLKKFLEDSVESYDDDPSEGLGAKYLNPHPNPWEHVDPILWGEESATDQNQHNLARTTFWDERASNAGFTAAWEDIKGMMKAGCLDQEVMLDRILQTRPGAAQVIALQQILNDALSGWWDMIAELSLNISPIVWLKQPAPSVRWESNRMWGAWRQACIEGDWKILTSLFEDLEDRVSQYRGPGAWEKDNWQEVQKQMLEYAQPALRRHVKSLSPKDLVKFNVRHGVLLIAEDLIQHPPKSFEEVVIAILETEPLSRTELVRTIQDLYPSLNFAAVGRLKGEIDNMRLTGRISYMEHSCDKLWAYKVDHVST